MHIEVRFYIIGTLRGEPAGVIEEQIVGRCDRLLARFRSHAAETLLFKTTGPAEEPDGSVPRHDRHVVVNAGRLL